MRKVSILIPHYRTFRTTASCIWNFKKYGLPIESEIVLCNNSPGHQSIRAITETSLGEGIKIVEGNANFPSHGQAYQKSYESCDGDWIFTAESDSFPTRMGWFNEYLKASVDYDYIGPEIPMGGGTYIHPAGALTHRGVIGAAEGWQANHKDWIFIPGAGAKLKTSDRGYHVVAHKEWLNDLPMVDSEMQKEIELWRNVGVWQEMRSFDEDTFDNYSQRIGVNNWEPIDGKYSYNKIGYEPGQWLSYFSQSHGFRCLKAPTHIEWMARQEGRQAAYSDVFGGFRHLWCGTVSRVSAKDLNPQVVSFKMDQEKKYFYELPEEITTQILEIEEES